MNAIKLNKTRSKFHWIGKIPIPWWILFLFLGLCLLGFVYEIFANTLGMNINLYGGTKAYYFDILILIIDSLLNLLTNLNPLFELINISIAPLEQKYIVILRTLAEAAILTLQLSIVSIMIGFVLGVITAVILVRPGKVLGLKWIAQGYVDFFRSTPLLVQLLIIFFGIPQLVQGLNIGLNDFRFTFVQAAVLGLSLNTGAYQAEIVRGGILAIPSGQNEAARGLGMTTTQTMRYVILPQALRIIIPPFTNEGIAVVLNSSLASVVSAQEIMRKASTLSSFYFNPFEVYLLAAMFYFVICYSLAKLTKRMEKNLRIPGLGIDYD